MRKFVNPRLAPESDGSGGANLDEFKALSEQLVKTIENQKSVEEKANEALEVAQKSAADLSEEVKSIGIDVAKTKVKMAAKLGRSGAEDWFNEMAKFISGIYYHKTTGAAPEWCKLSGGQTFDELVQETKAAATFTTTTDATAGYLVPTILRPGIIELRDIYGNLYPLLTKTTLPAGQSMRVPRDAASPVARWFQQAGTITEEATPMSFGIDTLVTRGCGTRIKIANELLTIPGVNFGATATARILKAINKAVETGAVASDATGDEPSKGFMVETGTNAQTDLPSATFANVVSFLRECVADSNIAFDSGVMSLFMTPADILSLATEAVGASELTGMLVWGNPRDGIPPTLLGYPVIAHPAMTIAATKYIALGDPSAILLAEDPAFSIDLNPYADTAHSTNTSWLRVFSHYDWTIGQPGEWHKAAVLA